MTALLYVLGGVCLLVALVGWLFERAKKFEASEIRGRAQGHATTRQSWLRTAEEYRERAAINTRIASGLAPFPSDTETR